MTAAEEVAQAVEELARRGHRFIGELREKGLHVGVGNPAVCVTCTTPWPCEHATGHA